MKRIWCDVIVLNVGWGRLGGLCGVFLGFWNNGVMIVFILDNGIWICGGLGLCFGVCGVGGCIFSIFLGVLLKF